MKTAVLGLIPVVVAIAGGLYLYKQIRKLDIDLNIDYDDIIGDIF